MSSSGGEAGRERSGLASGVLLTFLGWLFLSLSLSHLMVRSGMGTGLLLGSLLPAGFGLLMALAGLWVATAGLPDRDIFRVTVFSVTGILVGGLMEASVIIYQLDQQVVLSDPLFMVTNNMVAGGVGGFLVGYYVVVSSRHREEAEYEREIKEELGLLNRILRHDVRNQLNLIMGNIARLEGEVGEREELSVAREAAGEAVALTETARAFASSLEGEAELEPVDLGEVVEEQVERIRECYPGADIQVGEQEGGEVMADGLLSSVVRNLLTNAVVHNDEDRPWVEARSLDLGEGVVLEVEDNGPGISEEDRKGVLERGVKGDGSSGTGFGLYVTNRLVDRYGGSLDIREAERKGSVFRVELEKAG